MQTDPIGTADDLNLYAYVGNNPANATDPSGLAGEILRKYLEAGIRVVNQAVITHRTGIPFDGGFPVFSGVAKQTVEITQTGRNSVDFLLANKAAGLSETPKGFTWHDHENLTTMQLVPTAIHDAVGHTGGAAMARANKQSGFVDPDLLEGFLPWGLTPAPIASGKLYGSGTPYATSGDYDRANGTALLTCPK